MTQHNDFAFPIMLDALLAAFAPLPGEGIRVEDGPKLEWAPGDVLAVGIGDTRSATEEVTPEYRVGGRLEDETVRIFMAAYSWREDDSTIKQRRDSTIAIMRRVRQILDPDPALGGVVHFAYMGRDRVWVQNVKGGPSVACGFTIVGGLTI